MDPEKRMPIREGKNCYIEREKQEDTLSLSLPTFALQCTISIDKMGNFLLILVMIIFFILNT